MQIHEITLREAAAQPATAEQLKAKQLNAQVAAQTAQGIPPSPAQQAEYQAVQKPGVVDRVKAGAANIGQRVRQAVAPVPAGQEAAYQQYQQQQKQLQAQQQQGAVAAAAQTPAAPANPYTSAEIWNQTHGEPQTLADKSARYLAQKFPNLVDPRLDPARYGSKPSAVQTPMTPVAVPVGKRLTVVHPTNKGTYYKTNKGWTSEVGQPIQNPQSVANLDQLVDSGAAREEPDPGYIPPTRKVSRKRAR